MEDLEWHCAGECGCYPTPRIVPKSRREVNRAFDRSMLVISNSFAESIRDYFSPFAVKARARLAAAYVEDKLPKVYNFLTKIGVPRPY